ncbi:tetratricopeptide repeat protein [Amycolatopsis plumensis]|uniref:tetratricopeptide repeat protein n=1 Tax=Amycolatopsis plumensis TaxID=236508 RepID=UPI00366B26E6
MWFGLEVADKLGSVIGAVCGVLGLGLSGYGLLRVRDAAPPVAAGAVSVTNSITDTMTSQSILQAGTIGGAVTAGDGNVVGDHNLVAGPGGIVAGPGAHVVLSLLNSPAEPLPPPAVDLCVGRDTQVAEIVTGWNAGQSVVLTGGPGIGKSTVLGRAVTDPAIVASFGARRFVVSCDGAESASAVVDKMALVLGVAPGDHLRNRVLAFVREAPCVLILDNFETPADSDPGGAIELVAQLRAGVANQSAMGIGYRGGGAPAGLAGMAEAVLGPLPPAAAAEVFIEVAGDRHRGDPTVDQLVADLDGVPLAITLLATLARAETGLGTLVSAWRTKCTDLLAHAARPDRTSSLPVSIELSWDRLSPDARTALSLAALLPDGWPNDRSDLYLADELAAGVIELGSRGLLYIDHLRQRCLAPIRRHVAAHHPPEPTALRQLTGRVWALIELTGRVGGSDGAHALKTVLPEFTNITDVVQAALPHDPDLAPIVPDLLMFQRFTGLGDDQLVRSALASDLEPRVRADIAFNAGSLYVTRGKNSRARELFNQTLLLYRSLGSVLGEANCLHGLGDLEFRESNTTRARELFERSLPLYGRVGDVLGEANCLRRLGDLDFRESNHISARNLFKRTLPLYRRVGDALGEADCLRDLGGLEFVESNNIRARELFEDALTLYRSIGSVLGEANCLRRLGAVEFSEANNVRAQELFRNALLLYRRVGDALGEASCLRRLGGLELLESRNDCARDYFEQALLLYNRVDSMLGEANCLRGLGELEFREKNIVRARDLFDRTLLLYRRIEDRQSQAVIHAWLARLNTGTLQVEHRNKMNSLIQELGLSKSVATLNRIAGG